MGFGAIMAKRYTVKQILSGAVKTGKDNLSKVVSTLAAAANKRLKRIQAKGWEYAGVSEQSENTNENIAGVKKFGARGKNQIELQEEYQRLINFYQSGVSSVSEVRKVARQYEIKESQLAQAMALEREYKENDAKQESYYRRENEYVEYEEPLSRKERKDYKQLQKAERTRAKRRDEESIGDESLSEREWLEQTMKSLRVYNKLVETGAYLPQQYDSDNVRDMVTKYVAFYTELSEDELYEKLANKLDPERLAAEEAKKRRAKPRRNEGYNGTSSFIYDEN